MAKTQVGSASHCFWSSYVQRSELDVSFLFPADCSTRVAETDRWSDEIDVIFDALGQIVLVAGDANRPSLEMFPNIVICCKQRFHLITPASN